MNEHESEQKRRAPGLKMNEHESEQKRRDGKHSSQALLCMKWRH